jgi:hypothetical protein
VQFRSRQVEKRRKELEKQGHNAEYANATAEAAAQAMVDEKLRAEEEERPWLFKGQGVLEQLTVRPEIDPRPTSIPRLIHCCLWLPLTLLQHLSRQANFS